MANRLPLEAEGVSLPQFVNDEFEAYLTCGRLEYGFLRVKCDACRHEKLVAFSCKRRGFCPSCGARRMVETAAHLVEHVLPEQPIRQWVLSFPYPLRFLFATRPAVLSQVLGIVYRAISTFLIRRAGLHVGAGARTGAVTLIQRFGSVKTGEIIEEQEYTRIRALPFRPTAVIMCVGICLFRAALIAHLVEDSCGAADEAWGRSSRAWTSIRSGSVSCWCSPSDWR